MEFLKLSKFISLYPPNVPNNLLPFFLVLINSSFISVHFHLSYFLNVCVFCCCLFAVLSGAQLVWYVVSQLLRSAVHLLSPQLLCVIFNLACRDGLTGGALVLSIGRIKSCTNVSSDSNKNLGFWEP